MPDTPTQKQASDALKKHEHKLLDAFAQVFKRKKPPQSMRALAPFAMVLLLEAFGLAYLLDRSTLRLVLDAAKGVGKSAVDDDDLLDDSDDMVAIRWAAERQRQIDVAYRAMARDLYNIGSASSKYTFYEWIKNGHGPSRVDFERQWGERNPIDLSTAPKCFDPSAQLSILDAVGQGDGYLGAFVSNIALRSEGGKMITCLGQTLNLAGVETLDEAASRAVTAGWIAYLDHRGAVVGLRLIPRTDGIQTRLRAPLVNIVSMMYEPLSDRDSKIETLETKLSIAESNHRDACDRLNTIIGKTAQLENKILECAEMRKDLDRQWQNATGASDPEMARELTAQRVEQIASLIKERDAAADAARAALTTIVNNGSNGFDTFVGRDLPGDEIVGVDLGEPNDHVSHAESPGGWRMVWPDKEAAPAPLACANTIVAHRRGEFAELEFPATPKIFEQVRAWLSFHQFGICAPSFDSSKYGHCAIGANGEIPPAWDTTKEAKRNSYPGFVLFAPDGSARVVFRSKKASIGKVGKRKARKAREVKS